MSNVPIQESYIFRKNSTPPVISSGSSSSFINFSGQSKNIFIVILIVLLILSFLGFNILYYFAEGIDKVGSSFGHVFSKFLSIIGYSTGTLLDKTSETVAGAAKTGIDIADGAVDDLAKLMIKGSKINGKTTSTKIVDIKPDDSSSSIQTSISSGKQNWCLVGVDQGVRSCVEMNDYDKCMSGQIFPDKQRCIMPTGGAAK